MVHTHCGVWLVEQSFLERKVGELSKFVTANPETVLLLVGPTVLLTKDKVSLQTVSQLSISDTIEVHGASILSGSSLHSMLNSSTQICHYFNTRGGCKFGRNCRFSHVKYKPPIYRNNQRDGSSVKKEAEQETSEFKENFNQGTQSEEDGALKNQTTLEETGAVKEGKEKICFTFQKYKKCRFGENCRYLHSIPVKPDLSQRSDKNDGKHAASQKRNQNKPIPHRQEKGRKVCQYFKAGNCKKGDKCRFYHPLGENVDKVNTLFEKELEEGDVKDQEQDSKGIQLPDDQRAAARQKGSFKPRKPVTRPAPKQTTVKRDEASDEDIQKLNKTEREQLKRRLATNDLEIIDESDTDGCYRFNFASSDPDWVGMV